MTYVYHRNSDLDNCNDVDWLFRGNMRTVNLTVDNTFTEALDSLKNSYERSICESTPDALLAYRLELRIKKGYDSDNDVDWLREAESDEAS